ncbi:hypothetical protein Droror1_Dr00025401 [Drosera rotundifolia]
MGLNKEDSRWTTGQSSPQYRLLSREANMRFWWRLSDQLLALMPNCDSKYTNLRLRYMEPIEDMVPRNFMLNRFLKRYLNRFLNVD